MKHKIIQLLFVTSIFVAFAGKAHAFGSSKPYSIRPTQELSVNLVSYGCYGTNSLFGNNDFSAEQDAARGNCEAISDHIDSMLSLYGLSATNETTAETTESWSEGIRMECTTCSTHLVSTNESEKFGYEETVGTGQALRKLLDTKYTAARKAIVSILTCEDADNEDDCVLGVVFELTSQ